MASFRSTTLFILRTGYTGEDGVEIWADRSVGLTLFQTILQGGAVPCGLASRDTLRIEAGYPLYGHELSEETTPYEGGIGFVVKRKEGFLGAEVLRKFSLNSSFLTIRGIISEEKVPPREGYPLFGKDGKEVGKVTSGGFSPIIQGGIGLARIPNTIEEGTTLFMEVRGARRPVRVLHPPLHKEGRKISNHP
jgi:aminomethyltransferase